MAPVTVVAGMALAGCSSGAGSDASGASSTSATQGGSLAFPASSFKETTETVTTGSGSHEITYDHYEAIPYVSKPVDVTYQSMNVAVPVAIDGDRALHRTRRSC